MIIYLATQEHRIVRTNNFPTVTSLQYNLTIQGRNHGNLGFQSPTTQQYSCDKTLDTAQANIFLFSLWYFLVFPACF